MATTTLLAHFLTQIDDDADREILLQIDIDTLRAASLVDRYSVSVCTPTFWRMRFARDYLDLNLSQQAYNYRKILYDLQGRSIEEIGEYGATHGIIRLIEYVRIQNAGSLSLPSTHSLLKVAVHHNQHEVVRWLMANEATIHADNDCLLANAANNGDIDMVKLLIANGADIHDNDGKALNWAANRGHYAIVKFFLEIGKYSYCSLNSASIFSAKSGHLDVLKLLISADPDHYRYHLINFTREALKNGHLAIVSYLYSLGVDLRFDNDYPLRITAEKGFIDIVTFLIERGANIHAGNDCAVYVAARAGHLNIVELLVAHGAFILANNNRTIKSATKNHHYEIVEFLEKEKHRRLIASDRST